MAPRALPRTDATRTRLDGLRTDPRARASRFAALSVLLALGFGAGWFIRPGRHWPVPVVVGLALVGWAVRSHGAPRAAPREAPPVRPEALSEPPSTPTQVGDYLLTERLNAGAMGEVWRGKHMALGREAAIKLIHPQMLRASAGSDRLALRRRFEREARVTASLRSPHTVQVYDLGTTSDGTLYYAMELLDGMDLHALVTRFGPLPAERVVHIVRQACHALAEAHSEGVVHRDIKPGNLRITAQGGDWDVVKVLDFGLVQQLGPACDSLLGKGLVCGTPGYISPEAILNEGALDGRADLYALGCLAYRLLTGRGVFEAADEFAMLQAHLTQAPRPFANERARVIPPELERLILELLAKRPSDRPASAEAVIRRLDAVPLSTPWTQARAARWWRERGLAPRTCPTDDVTEPAIQATAPQPVGRTRVFSLVGAAQRARRRTNSRAA